jgi:predicted ATP-binding protein involved in virulence
MRKLTVRNFSVIKEADLEFGKITVLIGPQSSGKSLLCKLAYFLGKEVLDAAVSCSASGIPFEQFKEQIALSFSERFPPLTALSKQLHVEYSFSDNWIKVSPFDKEPTWPYVFDFSSKFVSIYNSALDNRPDQELAAISKQDSQSAWYLMFRALFSDPNEALEFFYIPAGRALFTDAAKGFATLQNTVIDPLLRRFSTQISWDANWRRGLILLERSTQQEIRKKIHSIVRGEVSVAANKPIFRSSEGQQIPLSLLSSGTQELLPMLNVLERLVGLQEHQEALNAARMPSVYTRLMIFLEEPESSVFPKTQYDLIQLFAWLANDPVLDFDWVITTHSPYILSSFNNLIEAGQIAKAKPELRAEIAKIIPEHYWIQEGDFKAYAIEDGVLTSIVAEDTGLVSANYLDQVSETIGVEFDELLRLGYVES